MKSMIILALCMSYAHTMIMALSWTSYAYTYHVWPLSWSLIWSTNLIVISDNDDDDDDIVDDALVPTQSVQSVTWCNNFFVARFFQIQGLAILHTHTDKNENITLKYINFWVYFLFWYNGPVGRTPQFIWLLSFLIVKSLLRRALITSSSSRNDYFLLAFHSNDYNDYFSLALQIPKSLRQSYSTASNIWLKMVSDCHTSHSSPSSLQLFKSSQILYILNWVSFFLDCRSICFSSPFFSDLFCPQPINWINIKSPFFQHISMYNNAHIPSKGVEKTQTAPFTLLPFYIKPPSLKPDICHFWYTNFRNFIDFCRKILSSRFTHFFCRFF